MTLCVTVVACLRCATIVRAKYHFIVLMYVLYLEISSRGGKIKVSRNKGRGGQAQLDVKSSK